MKAYDAGREAAMGKHQPTLIALLEGAVDGSSLTAVLSALEELCQGKAEHIATNWQDDRTARFWSQAAFCVSNAADWVEKAGL